MEDNKNEVIETATTDNDVVVGETVEPEEAQKEEIPEELAGLPEDIAREAMAEAKGQQNDADEEPESKTTVEESPDNVKKDEQDDILPNQKIPYSRFKKEVDKRHELESKIAELTSQLNAQQPTMAPGNMPLQPQPIQQAPKSDIPPQPIINAEVTEQLEQAIKQEAMRMSGLDADTVDSIEYMDEGDSRVKIWNTSLALARNQVYRRIEQERQRQIEVSRRRIAQHNENVLAYNKFAQEQMSQPDFEAVKNYAINDYFSKMNERYQTAIAEAYSRIENNLGSPQDTMLVERFFTDAQNEYRSTHGSVNTTKSNNTVKKVKQGQSFPRSGEISGAGSDGSITVATLEQMLETTPFEQIPEQYQRILLGYEE